jgi:hypothetical protein
MKDDRYVFEQMLLKAEDQWTELKSVLGSVEPMCVTKLRLAFSVCKTHSGIAVPVGDMKVDSTTYERSQIRVHFQIDFKPATLDISDRTYVYAGSAFLSLIVIEKLTDFFDWLMDLHLSRPVPHPALMDVIINDKHMKKEAAMTVKEWVKYKKRVFDLVDSWTSEVLEALLDDGRLTFYIDSIGEFRTFIQDSKERNKDQIQCFNFRRSNASHEEIDICGLRKLLFLLHAQ